MPRESLLSILQKEMKHDFPILSFNHQLTTKVMLSDNFRKWIFGFGMGDLFNSGFCNLGKLGRKICPVGNTRMFYLLKEKKKIEICFFPELHESSLDHTLVFYIHSSRESLYFQSVLDCIQREL